MFAKRIIGVGIPLAATGIAFSAQTPLKNDPKRKFYENESEVVPVPGTVIAAPASEIEALGANRIIDGISVRSDSRLESAFRSVRSSLYNAYLSGQSYLDQGYTKYHTTERQVTTTVGDLHHKSEDLLPNSIYIVVATLSGNIAARQRGIFSKILFPLVLGTASFKYFLPQTFDNTTGFIWRLEQQNIPAVAEQQKIAVDKAGELVQSLESTTQASKKSWDSGVQSFKKSIADVTGLNIEEDVSKKDVEK